MQLGGLGVRHKGIAISVDCQHGCDSGRTYVIGETRFANSSIPSGLSSQIEHMNGARGAYPSGPRAQLITAATFGDSGILQVHG